MYRNFLLCLLTISAALAQVQSIEFKGLKHVSKGTAYELLEIKAGDEPTQKEISNQIKALYASGYFKDVKIESVDDVLIIEVKEWPVISSITVKGNKEIKDENINQVLDKLQLKPGHPFNQVTINQFIASLKNQYHSLGYLNVKIEEVKQLHKQSVNLEVVIDEGPISTYQSIKFAGNKIYSVLKIRSVMNIATTNLLSYFTGANVYSEQKLNESIRQLKNFYYDHGYLDFEIVKKQVTFSGEKTRVSLLLDVYEGEAYTLKEIVFEGKIPPSEAIIRQAKRIEGRPFSRIKLVNLLNAYREYLGDLGYAFADVQDQNSVDKDQRTISIKVKSDPKAVYTIRKIDIKGNRSTQSNFLRNFLYQSEGQRYSQKELDDSRARLMNLGYLDSVQYTLQPVPTYHDKVDVIYDVKEKESVNSIMAQLGYENGGGIVLGANLNFKNFLGSGQQVTLSSEHNKTTDTISLTHFDPFYLSSGITRSTKLYYTKVNSDNVSATDYRSDNLGGGVLYGVPVSKIDHINFGLNYEYTKLKNSDTLSQNVQDFIDSHGTSYNNTSGKVGWTRKTYRDDAQFSQNFHSEFGFPLLDNDITYYTFDYQFKLNQRLYQFKNDNEIALEIRPHLAYGQGYGAFAGDLPFFKRYQAGGFGTVRNFKIYSLGPKDSNGDSLGGDILTTLNTNLYFPIPFVTDNPFKTAIFCDVGNVYLSDYAPSELRVSAGLMVTASLAGVPLAISFGKNISHKPGDQFNPIDFAIGMDF